MVAAVSAVSEAVGLEMAVSWELPYKVDVNNTNIAKQRAEAPVIITFFIVSLLSNILQFADIKKEADS